MFSLNNNDVYKFYYQFLDRHDFNSDELAILHNKYPFVSFAEIPEAWIVSIDEMVEDIFSIGENPLIKVSQKLGFLDVEFIPYSKKILYDYEPIIKGAEKELYLIDADLHCDLEYDEWWME